MYEILALPPIDACSSYEKTPVVFCGISIRTRRLEAAGISFFEKYEAICTYQKIKNDENKLEEEEDINASDNHENWRKKGRSRRGGGGANNNNNNNNKGGGGGGGGGISGNWSVNKLKQLVEGDCLYKRLNLFSDCSQEDIRKAYRKMAILHHPDKKQHQKKKSNEIEKCNNNNENNENNNNTSYFSHFFTKNNAEDKGNTEKKDEEEGSAHSQFLKIQEAYEVLSDEQFRRQYDSALPFDESIPEVTDFYKNYKNMNLKKNESKSNFFINNYINSYLNKNKNENNEKNNENVKDDSQSFTEEDDQIFFDVFTPVFLSNARWSSRKPVVKLGDMRSSMEMVKKFYDFWFNFESNREFAIHDEFDLQDAESREEKRWMMRENMKIRRKYMKAEAARINKLAENAYALDPRIRMHKVNLKKKKR